MIKLFEITPYGEFFFGGEATFGPGDNRHYYVRSNLLPQQTSLLGLLRYELLKSDPGAFDVSTDKITNAGLADLLIGQHGFDGATDAPFGIIEGLSPVFLLDEDSTPYFLAAKFPLKNVKRTWLQKKTPTGYNFQKENLLQANEPVAGGYQLMYEQQSSTGNLEEKAYDGKIQFEEMLVGAAGQNVPVLYDKEDAPDGVFIQIAKTGNRKNYEGATDDSGFFKQDMFKLRPGWRFAVLVAFNKDLPSGFGQERNAHFGAERRPFRLRVSEPEGRFATVTFTGNVFQDFEQLYGGSSVTPDLQQTVLLSDAQVTNAVYQGADFSLTDAVSFRHFRPNSENPNSLWQSRVPPKSARYNLLKRASSFFSHQAPALEQALKSPGAFRRIGYNYFKTISQ